MSTSQLAPAPGKPLPLESAAEFPSPTFPFCWTMIYRHGVNATLQKHFFFKGTINQAIERAQKHCGIMGYKYHYIRPMLCNIDVEEGIQLGTHNPRTGLPKE